MTAEKTPWNTYRTSPEGFVDAFAKRRMPLRRKIGASVAAAVFAPCAGIQADVIYSDVTTVQTAPNTYLAPGSIPCDNVKAVIFVDPGFGIQNAHLTAQKIAPVANKHNMCTRFVTYGTTADIEQLADKKAEVLRESRNTAHIINPAVKPNSIDIGESLGGIVAVRTRNRMIEKFGDEFSYPAIMADATPVGSEALRWGNPTVAETVARNCRWFKVGDFVMTLVTVLTDPNELRRAQLWDGKHTQFFWDVYDETKKASMQLRIHESCLAGQGMPDIDQTDVRTMILYAYTNGDPIVDGNLSKDVIKGRADGYFEEIHMEGNGIDNYHAGAWDDWEAYGPYYTAAIARMDQIIDMRERPILVRRAPWVPQPR